MCLNLVRLTNRNMIYNDEGKLNNIPSSQQQLKKNVTGPVREILHYYHVFLASAASSCLISIRTGGERHTFY